MKIDNTGRELQTVHRAKKLVFQFVRWLFKEILKQVQISWLTCRAWHDKNHDPYKVKMESISYFNEEHSLCLSTLSLLMRTMRYITEQSTFQRWFSKAKMIIDKVKLRQLRLSKELRHWS